jgi:acyl-coenzyme A synthetase/AMP-(fatty) acid ligase
MVAPIARHRGFDIIDCDHRDAAVRGGIALSFGDVSMLPDPPVPDGKPRWLYHTSGSTADPKGVWHVDSSVIAGCYGWISAAGATADDVYPIAFPLAHIRGAVMLSASMIAGHRSVVVDTFDAKETPLLFSQQQATLLGTA